MCVSLECVSISHLSPFRKLTLLATQDPLRPFCLELIKYVTINEPFEDDCDSGRYWGIDAPLIDGSDEQHDVWYVDHASLGLDLHILLRTVRAVLLREGISAAGEATMPEFRGSRQ